MSSDTLRACQRTGQIINAHGQEVTPADVIDRACRIYGSDKVMRDMLKAATGDNTPLSRAIDGAVNSVLSDIELELQP